MAKPKTIVTLDIGSSSIKLLELEKTLEGFKILNFLIKKIPFHKEKKREEIVSELLNEINISYQLKNKSVITVLPRHLFSVKYITLPSDNYQEISQMLPFEADKAFPFSLTKFELGFAIQKILPNKSSKILVAAIEKSIIEELLSQLEKVGLSIERIGLSSLSLTQVYLLEEKENAALINIGETSTEINIIYEQTLLFSRSFPVAGTHLTQALMSDLNLTREEAENVKLKGWPREKKLPSVDNWYNRLILEINRTIDAFLKDYPNIALNQVILSGGGSKLSGFEEFLFSNLNLKISSFSFNKIQIAEEIKKDFLENSYLFVINLGLALEDDKAHPFNLIPKEYQKQIEWRKNRKKVIFAAIASIGLLLLLEIFLALGLLWQTTRRKIIQRNLARLEPKVMQVMERREEIKLLEAYLKGFSPLEVLKNLSQIIPDTILIDRFSLDKDGKGEFTGMTLDHSEVSNLIKDLEKSPYFYNIFSRYSRTKTKQGKNLVEFAISFSVEQIKE